MGNQLHDTSVDPEPIIADLRPRLAERTAERDEAVEEQTATAGYCSHQFLARRSRAPVWG